jgi:hypothetical protein
MEPAGIETEASMSVGVPRAPSMAQDQASNEVSGDDQPASRTLDVSVEPFQRDIVTAVTSALIAAFEALEKGHFDAARDAVRWADAELAFLEQLATRLGGWRPPS